MKTLVSHIPAKLMSLLLAIVMVIPIATVSAGAVMYPADPNNMSIQTYTLGGNASAYSDANLSSRIGAYIRHRQNNHYSGVRERGQGGLSRFRRL
jgi:uncharacterized membrane protein